MGSVKNCSLQEEFADFCGYLVFLHLEFCLGETGTLIAETFLGKQEQHISHLSASPPKTTRCFSYDQCIGKTKNILASRLPTCFRGTIEGTPSPRSDDSLASQSDFTDLELNFFFPQDRTSITFSRVITKEKSNDLFNF